MAPIYIMLFCLVVLCILLMRRITIIEDQKFNLNDKLNLSDKEFINLFNENLKLVEKIADLKLMKRIQKNKTHEN